MPPLLEVIALSASDARRAQDGGADRVELLGTMDHDGLAPSPHAVEAARASTTLRIRAMVRLGAGFAAEGDQVRCLNRLARDFAQAGADGVVLGFLDSGGSVDVSACHEVLDGVGLPWTFHRAVDHADDPERAWSLLLGIGCDQVLTAGHRGGLGRGSRALAGRASGSAAAAGLMLAGGGLQPEHVPALRAAGVQGFHIGSGARPGRSFDQPVDPALVRGWRSVLDAAAG